VDAAAASKPSGESLNKRGSPLPLKKQEEKYDKVPVNKDKQAQEIMS